MFWGNWMLLKKWRTDWTFLISCLNQLEFILYMRVWCRITLIKVRNVNTSSLLQKRILHNQSQYEVLQHSTITFYALKWRSRIKPNQLSNKRWSRINLRIRYREYVTLLLENFKGLQESYYFRSLILEIIYTLLAKQ